MPLIEAEGLRKTYRSKDREVRALDGFDLAAEQGTVTGLLGPNGAGKTTAVKVLTTLIRPDQGVARVDGIARLSALVAMHFPAAGGGSGDELPDRPVLL